MSSVDPIPPGSGGRVIPHLVVDEGKTAIDFYREALGAELVHQMPSPDGRIMHAEMRIGEALFYLADDFPEFNGGIERSPRALGNSSCNLHLYVEDCDAAIDRMKRAGGSVTMEGTDTFWGDRFGTVLDPFGHHWSFATHVRDMTPEEMAEAARRMCGGQEVEDGDE